MYSDNWSKQFLIEKLQNFDSAKEIFDAGENFVTVKRKEGIDFSGFVMSLTEINYQTVKEICDKYTNLDFIVNIKKQYNLSGECISYLTSKNISFGGLGDFMRFCNQKNNKLIEDKDYSFVSRNLKQHDKVISIERLDNRRIRIIRRGLPEVIAIMINDYDITSESIRFAKELYKDFRVVIKTNPNGSITSGAEQVGETLNIDICKWGIFLGKLNSQWI